MLKRLSITFLTITALSLFAYSEFQNYSSNVNFIVNLDSQYLIQPAYAQGNLGGLVGEESEEDAFCKSKLLGSISQETCLATCPGAPVDCVVVQTHKAENNKELDEDLNCYGCASSQSCYDLGLIYDFPDCAICEANPFKKCVKSLPVPIIGGSIDLPKDSDGFQCWDCIDDPDTCFRHWLGSAEKPACEAACKKPNHKCVKVGVNPDNGYSCYQCRDMTPPKTCKDLGYIYKAQCGSCPRNKPKCVPATRFGFIGGAVKDETGKDCYECVKGPKTCAEQGLKSKCASDEICDPKVAPNGAKCCVCKKKPKKCKDYKMKEPPCKCKKGEYKVTRHVPSTQRKKIECCECKKDPCHPDLKESDCADCIAKGGRCEPITKPRGKPQCYRCVMPKPDPKKCKDLNMPESCSPDPCPSEGYNCEMVDTGHEFKCAECMPDDSYQPPNYCEDHPTHKQPNCAVCYQAQMACETKKLSDNPLKYCAKCLPPIDERCPKGMVEGSCPTPWCVGGLKCVETARNCHVCVPNEECAPGRYRTPNCDNKCKKGSEACQRIEGCEFPYASDPSDLAIIDSMNPEDKYCGPDITGILLTSLSRISTRASNLSNDEKGVIDGTMFLDKNGMSIDLRASSISNSSGNQVCPSKPCMAGSMKSVMLCGKCVMEHIGNDILFGFIANQLDVPWHIQLAGAHYAEVTSYGGLDPLASQAAYMMGNNASEKMKKNPISSPDDLCKLLNGSGIKTGAFTTTNGFEIMTQEQPFLKDCKPCKFTETKVMKDFSTGNWRLEEGYANYTPPRGEPEYCCYACFPVPTDTVVPPRTETIGAVHLDTTIHPIPISDIGGYVPAGIDEDAFIGRRSGFSIYPVGMSYDRLIIEHSMLGDEALGGGDVVPHVRIADPEFDVPDDEPDCKVGSSCDDANLCTMNDVCSPNGYCIGVPLNGYNDNNPCTIDTCKNGKVSHYMVKGCDAQGADMMLSDGEAGDVIIPGQKPKTFIDSIGDDDAGGEEDYIGDDDAGGEEDYVGDDDAGGEEDYVGDDDATGGEDYGDCKVGSQCDDGDACTINDRCNRENVCEGGMIDIPADTSCIQFDCDSRIGLTTKISTGEACDDGDACTDNDACTADGECEGTPLDFFLDIADTDPCTLDYCDSVLGVQHDATVAECNDGDNCTINDTCNIATGDCDGTPIAGLDDQNVCTVDTCDALTGSIVHDTMAANGTPCDDQNSETFEDTCFEGVCGSAKQTCKDLGFDGDFNECIKPCKKKGGKCLYNGRKDDFDKPCWKCSKSEAACSSASDCDDGNYCNGEEVCHEGICISLGNPCQIGSFCEEGNDGCSAVFECQNDAQCVDGNFCNGLEICNQGACQSLGNPCVNTTCQEDTNACGADGLLTTDGFAVVYTSQGNNKDDDVDALSSLPELEEERLYYSAFNNQKQFVDWRQTAGPDVGLVTEDQFIIGGADLITDSMQSPLGRTTPVQGQCVEKEPCQCCLDYVNNLRPLIKDYYEKRWAAEALQTSWDAAIPTDLNQSSIAGKKRAGFKTMHNEQLNDETRDRGRANYNSAVAQLGQWQSDISQTSEQFVAALDALIEAGNNTLAAIAAYKNCACLSAHDACCEGGCISSLEGQIPQLERARDGIQQVRDQVSQLSSEVLANLESTNSFPDAGIQKFILKDRFHFYRWMGGHALDWFILDQLEECCKGMECPEDSHTTGSEDSSSGSVISSLDNTTPMVKSIATDAETTTVILTLTEKINFSDWIFNGTPDVSDNLAVNPGFFTGSTEFEFGQLRGNVNIDVLEEEFLTPSSANTTVHIVNQDTGKVEESQDTGKIEASQDTISTDNLYEFTGIEEGLSYNVTVVRPDWTGCGLNQGGCSSEVQNFYMLEGGHTHPGNGPIIVNDVSLQDTHKPYITATSPTEDSDVGVAALGSDVVLTFNEDLDSTRDPKSQVGAFIIGLQVGIPQAAPQAVASDVTISGNTITINPTDNLLPGMQYAVILTSPLPVQDAGGVLETELAIAVANPDGEQGQPNVTPFNLRDNTSPIILADQPFYVGNPSENPQYSFTTNAGNLVLTPPDITQVANTADNQTAPTKKTCKDLGYDGDFDDCQAICRNKPGGVCTRSGRNDDFDTPCWKCKSKLDTQTSVRAGDVLDNIEIVAEDGSIAAGPIDAVTLAPSRPGLPIIVGQQQLTDEFCSEASDTAVLDANCNSKCKPDEECRDTGMNTGSAQRCYDCFPKKQKEEDISCTGSSCSDDSSLTTQDCTAGQPCDDEWSTLPLPDAPAPADFGRPLPGQQSCTGSSCPTDSIFADGFESGDTSAWSDTFPGGGPSGNWTTQMPPPNQVGVGPTDIAMAGIDTRPALLLPDGRVMRINTIEITYVIIIIDTPWGRYVLDNGLNMASLTGFSPNSIMALAKADNAAIKNIEKIAALAGGKMTIHKFKDIADMLGGFLNKKRKFSDDCFSDFKAEGGPSQSPMLAETEKSKKKRAKAKAKDAPPPTAAQGEYGTNPMDDLELDGPVLACGKQGKENVLAIMDAHGASVQTLTQKVIKENPNVIFDALAKAEGMYSQLSSIHKMSPQALMGKAKSMLTSKITSPRESVRKQKKKKKKKKKKGEEEIILDPNDALYWPDYGKKKSGVKARMKKVTATLGSKMRIGGVTLGGGGADYKKKKSEVNDQWGIRKVGYKPKSDASSAWNMIGKDYNQANTLVAVIDSGFDFSHPDGPTYVWVNDKEIPDNGIDDDANGFIDDVHGWNFLDNSNDLSDFRGHGTFVAGIIAAKANNKIGIAGINPGAVIMPLKVANEEGETNSLLIARAINYAVNNNARIINISLGNRGISKLEQTAVNRARRKGIFVAVASGNVNENIGEHGPASAKGVFTVGSLDHDGMKSTISNWGANNGLIAPGEEIFSLRSRSSFNSKKVSKEGEFYYRQNGTSFSTPMVAATASLMLLKNPQLTPQQIEDILHNTADDLYDEGWDGESGAGLLNAAKALNQTPQGLLTAKLTKISVNEVKKKIDSVDVYATVRGEFESFTVGLGKGKRAKSFETVAGPFSKQANSNWITRIDKSHLKGSKDWIVAITVKDKSGGETTARSSLTLK